MDTLFLSTVRNSLFFHLRQIINSCTEIPPDKAVYNIQFTMNDMISKHDVMHSLGVGLSFYAVVAAYGEQAVRAVPG